MRSMESLTGEIYRPSVIHIQPMGIASGIQKYKGFCEKFTFLKFMNRGRTNLTNVPT